jgi:hypothetical protein
MQIKQFIDSVNSITEDFSFEAILKLHTLYDKSPIETFLASFRETSYSEFCAGVFGDIASGQMTFEESQMVFKNSWVLSEGYVLVKD